MDITTSHQQAAIKSCNLSREAAGQAIEHDIECGNHLIEVKSTMGHGTFGTWCDENMPVPNRQCQKYMNIARNIAFLKAPCGALLTELGVDQANAVINEAKTKEKADKNQNDARQKAQAGYKKTGSTHEAPRQEERKVYKEPKIPRFSYTDALLILGLSPLTRSTLDVSFKKCAMKAHPDRGGSDEAMRDVICARGYLISSTVEGK